MGLAAASAGVSALQQAGPTAPQPRPQGRGSLAVAHGRRPGRKTGKDVMESASTSYFPGELSPELAGKEAELIGMIPDPANPPESLLDESDLSFMGASGSFMSASGSDFDWSAPAGTDWLMADYGGGGGAAASSSGGQQLGGAAADAGFFELKSEDWADHLVNEVGEGNSFRREQRERYGAPILNMANLAHATEEELLMGAEAQALLNDRVEAVMSDAMALHHHFFEHASNRYAVAVRFGEIMEEIEQDDWNVAVEGEEQAVPSWCRAAFALQQEYDALNQSAAEEDELRSALELKFFEDSVSQHVASQLEVSRVVDFGYAPSEESEERALESMLQGILPGADDDEEWGSEALAADLLSRAAAKAEAEYLAALSGDDGLDDALEVVGAVDDASDVDDVSDVLAMAVGDSSDEDALLAAAAGSRAKGGSSGKKKAAKGASGGAGGSSGAAASLDPLLDVADLDFTA